MSAQRFFAALFFLVSAFFLSAQEFPLELLRPQTGETPRFPRDYWIGELGRGEASEEAYRAAVRILARIVNKDIDWIPDHETALAPLEGMEIRGVRVGGGRVESDGNVSFLVRFLGREEAVSGELYVSLPSRKAENQTWRFDDLILDRKRPLSEGRYSPRSADMTPYERFF